MTYLVTLITTLWIATVSHASTIVQLNIDGPIGPATSDYVSRSLALPEALKADAILLKIDTPGGLDQAMRQIIRDILAFPKPVISYVSPSGARAASAGTFILYASNIAAMAPGTNLGAASPVQIGGGMPLPGGGEKPEEEKNKPTLQDKVLSDAVAYIRSLAEMQGKSPDVAETFVKDAASISAEKAFEMGVIDIIAQDREVLLKHPKINLENATIIEIEPDWRTELLEIITNPNVAYILLLVGIYGLIFEFTNPGVVAPGVIGGICLLLGLYALNVLPVNYAGLALIVLGLAFMVTEAFLPTFGALGIGGVIAFVVGSIMLLDMDIPGYGISYSLLIAMSLISAGVMFTIIMMALKARNRPIASGAEQLVGSEGVVTASGRVRVMGETWQAVSDKPLKQGQKVTITKIDGLTLTVEDKK
ncbi:MAG: NfeD family protein [Alphaproteobacteria bacterium]